ncbi:hypothetical protein M758_9G134900 [Ceratodon purpureus]|nr:hypothetical protein M758_9G134900 [Ceratodon purpureus]
MDCINASNHIVKCRRIESRRTRSFSLCDLVTSLIDQFFRSVSGAPSVSWVENLVLAVGVLSLEVSYTRVQFDGGRSRLLQLPRSLVITDCSLRVSDHVFVVDL